MPPARNPQPGPKRRILVVDDNRDSADPWPGYSSSSVTTRAAHDGLEAVEVAEEFRPEVILMDVGMPRLNGYEATRRIRERPWGRSVTIIALTGWGQKGTPSGRERPGATATWSSRSISPTWIDF